MKRVPDTSPIWEAWTNGGYLGGEKARPHGRITVQPDYYLNESPHAGAFPWTPVRWWQKANNDQVEYEVPGLQKIEISQSIDTDAATCTITLLNTKLDAFGSGDAAGPDLGHPGYLTPDRGERSNPWGYATNEWHGLLGVNACIRSYQGYGGTDKTIEQAITDGNLVLTGVWLVDTPEMTMDSKGGPVLVLHCRSMAKLLVDQEVFPPLVPPNLYPVSFYSDNLDVGAIDPVEIYGHTTGEFPPFGGKYVMGIETNHTSDGYWLVGSDGGVFSYGKVHYFGNPVGMLVANDFVVGIAATGDDAGYWIITSLGNVYAYGTAVYAGNVTSPVAPIIAIERMGDGSPNQAQYIAVDNVGHVYTFGGAPFFGGDPGGAATIVAAACRPQGDGYWLADDVGHVYAYGAAAYFGGASGLTLDQPITGMECTPSGDGYYLVGGDGGVFAYGDAPFLGSVPATFTSSVSFTFCQMVVLTDILEAQPGGPIFQSSWVGNSVAITTNSTTPNPTGVSILAYIDPTHVQISWTAPVSLFDITAVVQTTPMAITLNDAVTDIAVATNGEGYWLGAQDGGVFTYSEIVRSQFGQQVYAIKFYGSMPGAFIYYLPPNYQDFTSIIAYFLLWAGWYLYDGGATDTVYGNIETTGTHSTSIISADQLDKKKVIDVINTIKAIVGYSFYIGDEGEAHFEEPNFWESGNVLPDGTRVQVFPVIDEKIQLTSYKRSTPDQDLRSEIIVSSEDPFPPGPAGGPAIPGTVTTTFVPPQASMLKGMVKPAMWVNEAFISQAEQQIMCELIAVHIYFMTNTGALSMIANPMLQLQDQVQILERTAFENNFHYVRGIDSTMDLQTGEYTSQLTTNILSPTVPWAITKPVGSATGTTTIAKVIANGTNVNTA